MTRPDILVLVPNLARTGVSWISRAAPVLGRGRQGHGPRAPRRDLSRKLQDFTEAFSAFHGHTEAEFVGSSRALRAIYSAAETLAQLVNERLAAMRDALGQSRIGGADGIAAAALHDLEGGFAEASQELLMLQSVTSQLFHFRTQAEDIRRIGRFAQLSVFLFAVESARSADGQELFGAFVGELRALGDRILDVADTIDSAARQAQQAQEIQCQAMSASHGELSQLAKILESTASATAAEAQGLLDDSLAALKNAGAHMRQITQQAGEAVFYLQFGDIVRQKTEHIAAALQESVTQLAGAASEQEFRTQAPMVDQALAIQIGQLELIRSEVEAAQRKLQDAFETLGRETSQLKEILQGWHQGAAAGKSAGDALTAFKADLRRMEELHQRGHELRLTARRAAQSVSTASSRLAGHLTELKIINMDVHLQALNAIVKAAALGENGLTLSVLSMHVDWLYRESAAAVTEVVATLEAILKTTRQKTGGEIPGAAGAKPPALNSGMNRIVAAYEDCRQTSGSADELVVRQQAALAEGRESLGFLSRHLPAIEGQIQELRSFRQLLAPWIEADRPAAGAAIASLEERYTMHSEREIHAKLGQAAAPVTAPAPSAPAATAPATAVPTAMAATTDDNLELFDAPPAASTDSSPAPVPAAADAHGATPDAAAVKTPEASALGDNVELF